MFQLSRSCWKQIVLKMLQIFFQKAFFLHSYLLPKKSCIYYLNYVNYQWIKTFTNFAKPNLFLDFIKYGEFEECSPSWRAFSPTVSFFLRAPQVKCFFQTQFQHNQSQLVFSSEQYLVEF